MVPTLFLAIFLGRVATIVFFTTLALFGFKEFARATGLYADWWMTGAVYLGIIAAGVTRSSRTRGGGSPAGMACSWPCRSSRSRSSWSSPSCATGSRASSSPWRWRSSASSISAGCSGMWRSWPTPGTPTATCCISCWPSGSTTWRRSPSARLFGRHPLRGNISPRKTWEGPSGPWRSRWPCRGCSAGRSRIFSAGNCVLIGAIVGIGGQLGDLAISVIKRDLGIKDMGAAIPGHGGILDRIDSLIYVAPLFFHIVRYSHDLY